MQIRVNIENRLGEETPHAGKIGFVEAESPEALQELINEAYYRSGSSPTIKVTLQDSREEAEVPLLCLEICR